VLGPFIPLAAKLGHLAMELADGDVRQIAIEVLGELAEHDTRLLTVAALNGAFQGHTDQPVNYVNAPVIAADRGLPYEQTQFDRGVSTQNVADNASSGSSNATGVWSNDYNFIAPAQ